MAKATIEEIEKVLLNEIAVITGGDVSELSASDSLESLGVDSFTLVELFVIIEKEYGIKLLDAGLENDDLQSITTIATKINSLI